jgi:hypothetical protein
MTAAMLMMLAALGAELVLLLVVVLAISWFRQRAARRRDSEAIRTLVKRIKKATAEREAAVSGFLGERMGMSGEALEQAKTAMLRAQLVLLQRFAGVYKKRDAGAAAQFDIDVDVALAPYHELQGSGDPASEQPAAVDTSELEALRAENKRLSDELSITMETMSRMLNEYSTMFAGDTSGESAPIAALVGGAAAAVEDDVEETETETETEAEPTLSASNAEAVVAEPEVEASDPEDYSPQDDIDVLFEGADAEPAPEAPQGGAGDRQGDTDDVPAEVETGGSMEQPDADDSDQQIDIDALLTAAENGTGLQADDVPEAVPGGDATEVPNAADRGLDDQAAASVPEPLAASSDAGVDESGEPVAIDIEQGDNLESIDELLDEGPVEVVTFDESDDFDVVLAESEEDLFDAAEPETVAATAVDQGDGDELFDAGEGVCDPGDEPVKTQAGG